MSSKMADTLDALPERVDNIERKLDALSLSVDRRFDQVDDHFAEQRRYTEFAYERLDQRMTAGLQTLDQRVTRLERAMIAGFERLESALHSRTRRRRPARPPKQS